MNQTRLWLVMKEERMILERQLDVSATVNKEINYIAKDQKQSRLPGQSCDVIKDPDISIRLFRALGSA